MLSERGGFVSLSDAVVELIVELAPVGVGFQELDLNWSSSAQLEQDDLDQWHSGPSS